MTKLQLKPLGEQVVVLTGASSGIGLATAQILSERGAKLVLAARNKQALDKIVANIEAKGGQAIAVETDVSKREDVENLANKAIQHFGRIDSWINDAAVAIYGSLEKVPLEDHRRVFEVNYWGVVYGSLVAIEHLRKNGGALINVGSVLSDRSIIMQGPYSATKHAVKAFHETLRMELERHNDPISLTLIKPSAIDTPYMEHARNYMMSKGTTNPPPSYDPHLVAKAIAFACEYPKRDLYIGFGGYIIGLIGDMFPRITDKVMEVTMVGAQKSDNPGRAQMRDNLYQPREDGDIYSSLPGTSRKTSLYLEAQMNPVRTVALLSGLTMLGMALIQHGLPRLSSDKKSKIVSRRTYYSSRYKDDHQRSPLRGKPSPKGREASARGAAL